MPDSEDLWRARLRRRDYPDAPRVTPPSASPAMLGYAPGTFAGIANLQPMTILGPAVEGQPPTKVIDTTTSVRTWLFGPATLKAGRETVAHFVPYQWIAPGGRVLDPVTFRVYNGCLGAAPGVDITVTQGPDSYTGTTDSNGEAVIDIWVHSEPGDFDVTLDFPGSPPETRTVNIPGNGTVEFKSKYAPGVTLYVTDPGGTFPLAFIVSGSTGSFQGGGHVATTGYRCRKDATDPLGIRYAMDADPSEIACPTKYVLQCVPGQNAISLTVHYVARDIESLPPAVSDAGDDVDTSAPCPLASGQILTGSLDLTGIDLTGPFTLTFSATGPYAAQLYGGDTLVTVSSIAP